MYRINNVKQGAKVDHTRGNIFTRYAPIKAENDTDYLMERMASNEAILRAKGYNPQSVSAAVADMILGVK